MSEPVLQQYRLLKLGTDHGDIDLTGGVVLILPRDLHYACLVVQLGDGRTVPLVLANASYKVEWIAYRLTAWTESIRITGKTKATYAPGLARSIILRHPVKHRCLLAAQQLRRPGSIHLFTRMPLNDILGCKQFPKVQGHQFIC